MWILKYQRHVAVLCADCRQSNQVLFQDNFINFCQNTACYMYFTYLNKISVSIVAHFIFYQETKYIVVVF